MQEISIGYVFAFLLVALPAIAVAGYRYGRAAFPQIISQSVGYARTNFSPMLLHLIEQGAAMAVRAAEQVALKEKLEMKGEEKLAYALDVLQNFLNEAGFEEINVKLLEAAIRAALRQELHKSPPQPIDIPFSLLP